MNDNQLNFMSTEQVFNRLCKISNISILFEECCNNVIQKNDEAYTNRPSNPQIATYTILHVRYKFRSLFLLFVLLTCWVQKNRFYCKKKTMVTLVYYSKLSLSGIPVISVTKTSNSRSNTLKYIFLVSRNSLDIFSKVHGHLVTNVRYFLKKYFEEVGKTSLEIKKANHS